MADTLTQNTSGVKLKLGGPGGSMSPPGVEVVALQRQIATLTLTIKELRNGGNPGATAARTYRQASGSAPS